MTSWLPDIETKSGPRYLAIAQALAEDVDVGRLAPGSKMPTHRDLAFRLGLTVGTISRAYAEAQRLGLLSGEVGRGTYVRDCGNRLGTLDSRDALPDGQVDLSLNYPPISGIEEQAMRRALRAVADSNDLSQLLNYQHHGATAAQFDTAASWLAHADIPVVPERLIITAGLQHAMTTCIAALCEPGDLVLAESLTYPGIRALGIMHHLRLQGVAMDDQGLVPDAFEAACRGGSVRALYTIPTLQNPTATILPEDRRRKIADIARRFDVTIIEDDLYGFHLPDAPPRIAALAPDITIYLTSVSKCLMPGLRVGFAVPPERLMSKLSAMVRSTLWMNAPPMIEVFRQLVASGDAERVVAARHAEAAARQDIAQRVLGDFAASPHRMSPHLWLPLPEHWQGNDFVSHARMRNVIVSTADDFALTHETGANHARLCLGCPPSRGALETALGTIGELLREGPDLSWSFA